MRYFDDLKAKGFRIDIEGIDCTEDAICINGDSVVDAIGKSAIKTDTLNIAPPFPLIAFEYRRNFRYLCIVKSVPAELIPKGSVRSGVPDGAMWASEIEVYCDAAPGQSFCLLQWIDGDGHRMTFILGERADYETSVWAQSQCLPYFVGVSILNCKNTYLSDIPNPPSYERRFAKWNKIPATQYKEIKVTSIGKKSGTGISGESGITQGMHVMRGHFKDYTSKGLFGKLHGVYWWQSSVRGDMNQGIIEKSYKVEAPRA